MRRTATQIAQSYCISRTPTASLLVFADWLINGPVIKTLKKSESDMKQWPSGSHLCLGGVWMSSTFIHTCIHVTQLLSENSVTTVSNRFAATWFLSYSVSVFTGLTRIS